jgi:hypothetical protein
MRKYIFTSTNLQLTLLQWTLANVFDRKGWLFPKLELAVTLIYWTINFLFDQEIDACEPRKKGVDYYVVLLEWLEGDRATVAVCSIFR